MKIIILIIVILFYFNIINGQQLGIQYNYSSNPISPSDETTFSVIIKPCFDKIYNLQLNTCVFINDTCLSKSYINVIKINKTENPTDFTYSLEIYDIKEDANQMDVGCSGVNKASSVNYFNCSNLNENGEFKEYDKINVTCKPDVRINVFYKYSIGNCKNNVEGQLNKCSYLVNNTMENSSCGAKYTSVLFSGNPYSPILKTFSNGYCDISGKTQEVRSSCSSNSEYELKCYEYPIVDLHYGSTSSSLVSSLLFTIVLLFVVIMTI